MSQTLDDEAVPHRSLKDNVNWGSFGQSLRRIVWVSRAGLASVAGLIISYALNVVAPSAVWRGVYLASLAGMIAATAMWIALRQQLQAQPCPRCGAMFYPRFNLRAYFVNACQRCGLAIPKHLR